MKIRTTIRLLCSLIGFGFMLQASAQQTQITGTIKNENGEAIEAASVQVVGNSKGTLSDKNGTFSLSVLPSDSLRISAVGYGALVVKATPALQVVLHESAGNLNEVVVIGYGTQRKKELTGSIATVTSKDFQKGNIVTPEQLIAGKVAGVSVTSNSGSPGAGSTIRIRGGASLNASNDPLIVIDGVPLSGNNIYGASNQLSTINPNDIASFSILKDAAATAIYGSRASNGVIIITTKKGTSGKPVINFSTQLSVSTLAKKAPVMSHDQFKNLVDSIGGNADTLLGDANTDWQKEIFHNAFSTDNNISISGSLKNLPYRISLGYLNQDGILKTDNLQRTSAGISLTPGLFKNSLKIEINVKGSVSKARFANGAAISSAVYFDPTQPVYDASSPYGGYFEWASVDPTTGAVTLNKLAPKNPVALLDLYNNNSMVQRSFGNIRFDYALPFLPDLHANLNLGYDVAKGDGKIDVPAYAAQNYLDSGLHNKYSNKINNTVAEFYLNYNKNIDALRSNINVTAGYGYYNNLSTNYNFTSFRANGDTIPGSIPKFPLDKPENTLISYYGRLIYTLMDKYIVAASIRTDGSSRFASDVRWGTFPSVAFTWRINQEGSLKDSKTLSDLKLRLSYGITGNQDGIANYSYLPVYSLSDNASQVLFGDSYYSQGTPAAYDSHIKWEQTETYNAGLDFGFLKNRISGSVDYYYKKTKDLLNLIPIPAGSNFSSSIVTNVGNVENKGVELLLNFIPVQTKNFQWNVSFNASYNTNKITNLTATKDPTYPGTLLPSGVQINSVGYNASAFYVYHQEYGKDGKPIEGVYEDINGDGVINQNDLYRYKSPFPKYIFGFSTEFSYKRWTLSAVLRANTGNYMYNGLAVGATESNIINPLGYLANTLNSVLYNNFYYGQQQSDYFIENASFLKMDNLGLSYDAGYLANNKLHLQLNANCQNVFTVTKYSGLDPEIYGGVDNSLYPRPRIFTLGVNLQF
ncbi:MAG: TonB-dependent receptor [Parafilimonas sp.]